MNVVFSPRTSLPQGVNPIQIVATHPRYFRRVGFDDCRPDDCVAMAQGGVIGDTCNTIWDDGIDVIRVCTSPVWWRPGLMTVHVGPQSASGHYLQHHRKIDDAASWPQVFVLYQDGSIRLKPHPPSTLGDVCFGSSVVLGPVDLVPRPHADVAEARFDPARTTFSVTYAASENGVAPSASLRLFVNRKRAVAEVGFGDPGFTGVPIGVFRSTWIDERQGDVGTVRVDRRRQLPILGAWDEDGVASAFFFRRRLGIHNPSAPDLRIETGWDCRPGMRLRYDDLVSCTQATSEDTNRFRFFARPGDRVVIEALRRDGSFDPCVELRGPDDALLERVCSLAAVTIEATIERRGMHAIVVDDGHDFPVFYALGLRCVAGSCT